VLRYPGCRAGRPAAFGGGPGPGGAGTAGGERPAPARRPDRRSAALRRQSPRRALAPRSAGRGAGRRRPGRAHPARGARPGLPAEGAFPRRRAGGVSGEGRMTVIAVEEHYIDPEIAASTRLPERLMRSLSDTGEGRLASMDEAGIDVEVLSHAPPGPQEAPGAVSLARRVNDRLATLV